MKKLIEESTDLIENEIQEVMNDVGKALHKKYDDGFKDGVISRDDEVNQLKAKVSKLENVIKETLKGLSGME
jgi:hypothetical protein